MLSSFRLHSRHWDIMVFWVLFISHGDCYLFFCKQIDLVASFELHSIGCMSNISSVFKTFSVSFESVLCLCVPLPSLGPGQSSIPKGRSQSCWHAV